MRTWVGSLVIGLLLSCGIAAAEGPQVFYPCTGNLNDFSGNTGRNGTNVGTAPLTTDHLNVTNCAYTFNGSSQYITSPYVQGSAVTAYSIAAWFMTGSGDNDGNTIVSARNNDGDKSLTLCMSPSFGSAAGRLFFGLDSSGVGYGVRTTSTFNNSAWHHVVGVFSRTSGTITNSDFKIYVDGVLQTTDNIAVGTPWSAPIANSSTIQIGRQNQWGNGSCWNGRLDDIAIYDRALTAGDVACLYSTTATMKSTWEFNTSSNVEGWSALSQIASGPTQTGGQMQYTTAAGATDPMIASPQMEYPITQGAWLKVRAQNLTTSTGAIMFWDNNLISTFVGSYQANYEINPSDTQVSEYWVNMATAGGTYWTNSTYIQQFRFDFPDSGGTQVARSMSIRFFFHRPGRRRRR